MHSFSRMKCKKLHSFVYLSPEDSLTFVPENTVLIDIYCFNRKKNQNKRKVNGGKKVVIFKNVWSLTSSFPAMDSRAGLQAPLVRSSK